MPLVESQPTALSQVYARSLYELAESKGGREAVEATVGELEGVMELARSDPRFSEFLASRVLSSSDRKRSLESIFRGKVSDLTLNFLQVLNEKGRLAFLPPIVAAMDEHAQRAFGKIEVDVYTASPMSSEELSDVKHRLERALGREPVVHPYVDGSMIGGVKLQIGDRLVDASVSTRLRQIKDRMAREGVGRLRSVADRLMDSSGDE